MHQLVLGGTLMHSWHGEAPLSNNWVRGSTWQDTSWLRLCNLIQSPFQHILILLLFLFLFLFSIPLLSL